MLLSDKIDTLEKFLAHQAAYYGWDTYSKGYYLEYYTKEGDLWWKTREAARDETRVNPSWACGCIYADFCIYITAADPMKIGYTPTPEYGRADRQIVTTIGRFFKKHFPDTPDDVVRDLTAVHRANYADTSVSFAFDADDIMDAYERGPSSCMSGKDWTYEHPARVYDGPDTAVACLKHADGRITARTVCDIRSRPMQYTRVYGDAAVLQTRLTRLGFVEGDLDGARLRLAETDRAGPVCPYVDYTGYASIDGKYLVLGRDGHYDAQQTRGYLGDPEDSCTCGWCDDACSEDDMHSALDRDLDGISICDGCYNNDFVYAVVSSGGGEDLIPYDMAIELGGSWFLNNYEVLEGRGFVQDHREEWVVAEDVTYIESESAYYSNDVVCTPQYCSDAELKDNCTLGENDDWIRDDDVVTTHDGRLFHTDDTWTDDEGQIWPNGEGPKDPLEPADPAEFAARQGQLEVA